MTWSGEIPRAPGRVRPRGLGPLSRARRRATDSPARPRVRARTRIGGGRPTSAVPGARFHVPDDFPTHQHADAAAARDLDVKLKSWASYLEKCREPTASTLAALKRLRLVASTLPPDISPSEAQAAVALMTRDHLSAQQKSGPHGAMFFNGNRGWGLGIAVDLRRDEIEMSSGRFGWDGGYGTSAYADPAEGLIGILMTQRMMDSPTMPLHFRDFWTGAYTAIDD